MKSRSVYIILILLCTAVQAVASLSPADSIRRLIPRLSGEKKLDALAELANIYYGISEKEEIKAYDCLIQEATRQNNTQRASHAMALKLCAFTNYGDLKSLEDCRDDALDNMRRNNDWHDYYDTWAMIAGCYSEHVRMLTATKEAKLMYEDARRRGNKYGLGIAGYVMGQIYLAQENITEAEKAYEQAIKYLKASDGDATTLLDAYSDLADLLSGKNDYRKMGKLVDEWKKTLDRMKTEDREYKINIEFYNSRYKLCYISMANVAMNTGKMKLAGQLLDKAMKLAEGGSAVGLADVQYILTLYLVKRKDYQAALSTCRQCLNNLRLINSPKDVITLRELEAEILIDMGRPAQAALIYRELSPQKDSLFTQQSRAQLNELSTIYRLDELTKQKEHFRLVIYGGATGTFILLLAFIFYFIYQRRMRAKNRAIYEQMIAELTVEAQVAEAQQYIPEEKRTPEQLLYQRICSVAEAKKLYQDPEMNRDKLAAELGTNYTYIVDAIHHCADGMSVTEFLNKLRLQHSVKLLTENPEMSINEISDLSGFNSRVSFYRQFRQKYAISPTEYRRVALSRRPQDS